MSGVAQPQDPFPLKEHLLPKLSWERAGRCVRIGCSKITMMRYSSCLRVFSGGRKKVQLGRAQSPCMASQRLGNNGKVAGCYPTRQVKWLVSMAQLAEARRGAGTETGTGAGSTGAPAVRVLPSDQHRMLGVSPRSFFGPPWALPPHLRRRFGRMITKDCRTLLGRMRGGPVFLDWS